MQPDLRKNGVSMLLQKDLLFGDLNSLAGEGTITLVACFYHGSGRAGDLDTLFAYPSCGALHAHGCSED